MSNIFLPYNSAVMFVKCESQTESICNIPDMVLGENDGVVDNNIKLKCVRGTKESYLSIKNIASYYRNSTEISLEDFKNSSEKHIFFTIDLRIEQMVNLQYILVMDSFFRKNNINYYLILNTDDSQDTYFKLYHYFNMRYKSIYNKIYVRTPNQVVRRLPNKDVEYLPGEILPYFYIDQDFYQSSFNLFEYSKEVFEKFKLVQDVNDIKCLFKQYYEDLSDTEFSLLRYIYSCLTRNSSGSNLIADFLEKHPCTPILSVVLFVAILNKANLKEYDVLYENCLDYALGIEQLIENALFYAGNGILSIRIHQSNSLAMSNICKNPNFCKYLLEISLIDFQEKKENRSITTQFVQYADASEEEKNLLYEDLKKSDGLKNLFELSLTNAISKYFRKPNVIIQHYGLQTIAMLAKKTNSLLCIRSGEDYYSNKKDDNLFFEQRKESYLYKSGVFYRIIIPIRDEQKEMVYIGFDNNKYNCIEVEYPYAYFKNIYSYLTDIPKNREEKANDINHLKCALKKEYKEKSIFVINTQQIKTRLHLEYIIKAALGMLHDYEVPNKKMYMAIIGLRNKAFLKLSLRFIKLCYDRYGKNEIFKNNELFLCTEDCKTEILISGENYNQILGNVSSQRIFGTIDDDLLEEIKLTLKQ